jgi:hypothetical protein
VERRETIAATVLGGLLAGAVLHLATPTSPLPMPEPAWRKAMPATYSPDAAAYYSAQTYTVEPARYDAAPQYPPNQQPGFVPHPHEQTLAYAQAAAHTPYDSLPRYDAPAARERVDTGASTVEVVPVAPDAVEEVLLPDPASPQ